jgi:hypothetical protein
MKKLLLLLFCFNAFAQERDFCSELKSTTSKFDDKVTWHTPLLKPLSFTKTGKTIYLSLRIKVYSPDLTQKGVTLLLSDGSKISKPNEKVKYDYSDGYYCTAFILLTQKDIEKLNLAYITDYKLYIHEHTLIEPYDYYEYFICLLNK